MNDIAERVFNPGVLFTMVVAGLAYGRLLWSFKLYPNATLAVIGIAPGAIFMLTVWAIRAAQGTASTVYILLFVDWLIFACTGVLAVLVARRRHPR